MTWSYVPASMEQLSCQFRNERRRSSGRQATARQVLRPNLSIKETTIHRIRRQIVQKGAPSGKPGALMRALCYQGDNTCEMSFRGVRFNSDRRHRFRKIYESQTA